MRRSNRRNGSPWTNKFEVAASARMAQVVRAYTPGQMAKRLQNPPSARFDTMVVDCEGCFAGVIASFPRFVGSLQTVLLEADYGTGLQDLGYVDYNNVTTFMFAQGFIIVEQFLHPCCQQAPNRIPMIVFQKPSVQQQKRTGMSCAALPVPP